MRGRVFQFAVAAVLLCGAVALWWVFEHRDNPPPTAPVLRVGLYSNPPKLDIDANGQPTGLFVTLLDSIAQEEGWTLKYQRCEWSHCLQLLENGQLDLMPDMAYTVDRAQRFNFPDVPIVHSWSQAYIHPGTNVKTLEDLAGKKISVVKGSIQQLELQMLLGGMHIAWTPVYTANYEDVFRAIQNGSANVAIVNNFFGTRFARRYNLRPTSVILNPHTLFITSTQGRHARELARIDYWIARWQQDPESIYFQATRRALMPEPDSTVPEWLWPAATGVALFVLLLILFSFYLRWRVKNAVADANRARSRLERVLDVSPVVLLLSHIEGERLVVDWISPNAQRLLGIAPDAQQQSDWWRSRVHPDDLRTLEPVVDLVRTHAQVTREYRFLDAQGNVHFIHEDLRRLPNEHGAPVRVLASWTDQSESKAHAAELTHLAHHDALTGLPNRRLLKLYLDDAVAAGNAAALLLVDLDRLRGINDTLGQTIGDQVLRATTQRLQTRLPQDGFLARHGGDEFAIVLHSNDGVSVEDFAQDILESFTHPLLGMDSSTILTASIGIALFPFDGNASDTLMRHAELALYDAKRVGSGRRQYYDPSLSYGANERLMLESGLRMALANREFRLHYQPQVRLHNGEIAGVEALLRWQHPELGPVSPTQFIPIAEEVGLITDIGHWVLIEACRQLRAWDDAGIHIPCMSVNCSVNQLDVKELPAQIQHILSATGLAPHRLELEITESVLMRDPEQAIAALNALKVLGIRLAIDDFGTGYSSLAYLRRMPVTRLKIDRTFVNGIGKDPNDERICHTVMSLAQSLQLETIAEGVEHAHEVEFLRSGGNVIAQGYFYAPAMPPSEFATWLDAHLAVSTA